MDNLVLSDNSNVKINYKNLINGFDLLKNVRKDCIKTIFFDPEYRGILDKMKYGNEGISRGKERCSLDQMDFNTIQAFFKEFVRVLMPSGYLFLWIDKFHLVDGVKSWFNNVNELECVDLITWNKEKIGMGYRTRRKSEYLLILQKKPKKAKNTCVVDELNSMSKTCAMSVQDNGFYKNNEIKKSQLKFLYERSEAKKEEKTVSEPIKKKKVEKKKNVDDNVITIDDLKVKF